MKLLDLIFELLRQHVPIKQDDWAKTKAEAESDVATWHSEHENKFKAMYAKYNNHWAFRVCVAIAFIPITRAIARYMNPVEGVDTDETF